MFLCCIHVLVSKYIWKEEDKLELVLSFHHVMLSDLICSSGLVASISIHWPPVLILISFLHHHPFFGV